MMTIRRVSSREFTRRASDWGSGAAILVIIICSVTDTILVLCLPFHNLWALAIAPFALLWLLILASMLFASLSYYVFTFAAAFASFCLSPVFLLLFITFHRYEAVASALMAVEWSASLLVLFLFAGILLAWRWFLGTAALFGGLVAVNEIYMHWLQPL